MKDAVNDTIQWECRCIISTQLASTGPLESAFVQQGDGDMLQKLCSYNWNCCDVSNLVMHLGQRCIIFTRDINVCYGRSEGFCDGVRGRVYMQRG